jgi:hypothetical protein
MRHSPFLPRISSPTNLPCNSDRSRLEVEAQPQDINIAGNLRFDSDSLRHQGFVGSTRLYGRPLNYLRAIRSHRNCACLLNGGCCIVPWKGTGRRQPRMRYSGAVVLWAQSSLAAPFSFHRLTGTTSQRVIQMPTKISSFSRLSNLGAKGVKLGLLWRGLKGRSTRSGGLGNVKGGCGGMVCRPFSLGTGGRSLRWLRPQGIGGRQGCFARGWTAG